MLTTNTSTKRDSTHAFPVELLLLASAVAIWSVINVQDTYSRTPEQRKASGISGRDLVNKDDPQAALRVII